MTKVKKGGFIIKSFLLRFVRLVFGLTLCSIGIVFMLQANIGFFPWDVFHAGIAKTIGTSIGVASILVGIVIVISAHLMKEKFGLGTIVNMILVGLQMDFILGLNIIPLSNNFFTGILMIIIGMFLIGFGSYFYIGAGFGTGPRDSLMVILMRRTKKPAGVCRASVECCAVIAGWLLGGMVGIGTVLSAFGLGACIQISFKICKFDAKAVPHETLAETFRSLFKKPKD